MRIETTRRELFAFNELPEDAQRRALEDLYDINTQDSFWYEYILDDAKEIGAIMGIDIDQIYFSGSSPQGDDACFTGTYSYKKGAVKAVKEYAPLDETLHKIAQDLFEVQKRNFYGLSAIVSHSGHYYHRYCTDIAVDYDSPNCQELSDEAESDIIDTLRDFMHWIHSSLEAEYYYLTSEEAIKDTIDANDYEFTENGKLA